MDTLSRAVCILVLLLMGLSGCTAASPTLHPTNPPTQSLPAFPTATEETTATTLPATPLPPTITPVPTIQILVFNDDELRAQLDRLAAKFMRETRDPGLSIAVAVRNPQLDQLQFMLLNYGMTSKEDGQPTTSDTEYEIGSVTKVFTGILLAEAIEAGNVHLDDSLQNYLPDGIRAPSYNGIHIKIVDLATHRSSLPRDVPSDDPQYLYTYLNSLRLDHAPGSEYEYSNFGYELLGDILARGAGVDYGSLEYKSVSAALGLADTAESLSNSQETRLAQGYQYDGTPGTYFPQAGAMGSAGYLHSTLNDMARFLAVNMEPSESPLGPSLKLAQTPAAQGRNPDTGAGLGWDILRPDSPDARVWKDGATSGFSSYISFARDGSSGFVLLTNGQYIDHLASDIIKLLGE